ncbi:MAG: hypothetical protein RLZZ323_1150 [Bacteroidota bacterium]|jgi:site-specific recombinase XerD
MTITLENYLIQQLAPPTAKSYLFTIEHFIKTNPNSIKYTYREIISYMEQITQRQSNPQYRIRILAAIKQYYNFLIFSNQRNNHPCRGLTIKSIGNHAIQIQDLFTTQELELLLHRENRYAVLELRNRILIELLIYQGLTSDEIERLTINDINLDNGTIYIKASKKLNRRILKLLDTQVEHLYNYMNDVRPTIVQYKNNSLLLSNKGNSMTVDGIHAVIEALKPLFPDRKLNPRTIRMSVISNWLNEKKLTLEQTQELSGHKWPGTTEKYFSADSENERKIINHYFPSI